MLSRQNFLWVHVDAQFNSNEFSLDGLKLFDFQIQYLGDLIFNIFCISHREIRTTYKDNLISVDATNPTGASNPTVEVLLGSPVGFLASTDRLPNG